MTPTFFTALPGQRWKTFLAGATSLKNDAARRTRTGSSDAPSAASRPLRAIGAIMDRTS